MSTALLVLDYKAEKPLVITDDAISKKTTALNALVKITRVTTPEERDLAVNAIAEAKGVLKRMEESRVIVKAPVLAMGKEIDALAKNFCVSIESALSAPDKALTDYNAAELAKAQKAEQERLEVVRKANEEAERVRREEAAKIEADRVAAEKSAKAEAERIAKLEAQKRPAKPEDLALAKLREENAREAAEEAQRAAKELEVKQSLERAEQERVAATAKPIEANKAAGSTVKVVWKFEVLDSDKVFAAHRFLVNVEVIPSAVNAAIRAGLRECPGLRIYSEVDTNVRAK